MLLLSCDTPRLSAGRRQVGEGGIRSVKAPTALGPYPVKDAQLVVGEALYGGRVIEDRAGRTVMPAFETTDDDGTFPGSIGDPFPCLSSAPQHCDATPTGMRPSYWRRGLVPQLSYS